MNLVFLNTSKRIKDILFDEEEVEEMKKMGFEACGLGKRILRSETAPLYMLSVIGYERELNCEGRRED